MPLSIKLCFLWQVSLEQQPTWKFLNLPQAAYNQIGSHWTLYSTWNLQWIVLCCEHSARKESQLLCIWDTWWQVDKILSLLPGFAWKNWPLAKSLPFPGRWFATRKHWSTGTLHCLPPANVTTNDDRYYLLTCSSLGFWMTNRSTWFHKIHKTFISIQTFCTFDISSKHTTTQIFLTLVSLIRWETAGLSVLFLLFWSTFRGKLMISFKSQHSLLLRRTKDSSKYSLIITKWNSLSSFSLMKKSVLLLLFKYSVGTETEAMPTETTGSFMTSLISPTLLLGYRKWNMDRTWVAGSLMDVMKTVSGSRCLRTPESYMMWSANCNITKPTLRTLSGWAEKWFVTLSGFPCWLALFPYAQSVLFWRVPFASCFCGNS